MAELSKHDTAELLVEFRRRGYIAVWEPEYKKERAVLRQYRPGQFRGA
jgi:hypothetical protein